MPSSFSSRKRILLAPAHADKKEQLIYDQYTICYWQFVCTMYQRIDTARLRSHYNSSFGKTIVEVLGKVIFTNVINTMWKTKL
jgi:hypothetical protein